MAARLSILVYDAAIASPGDDLFIERGFVYIEGGVVRGVGEGEPPAEMEAAELVVGGEGRLAVPGLVSAHTHLLLYPLRHLLPHGDPAASAEAARLASMLGEGDAYRLALLALYELTLHGVTIVQAVDPLAEPVARAMRAAGVRGVVAVPLPGCRYSRSDWREQLELLLERRGGGVEPAVAACTPRDVEEALRLRREHGVAVYGHPPGGHRDPRVDVALHVEPGVGGARRVYVPVPGGVAPEPPVGLGLDAVGIGNPLRAALVAAWQGLGYREALLAVGRWGAEALGLEGGSLRRGSPGDIVVFDLSLPPGLPARRETLDRLLLDAEPRVELVVAAGRPLVDQGTHITIDEGSVREAARLAMRLAEEITGR